MTTVETCQIGNFAPANMLELLAESQGGIGRHKCAICAYREGVLWGSQGENEIAVERCEHGNSAPVSVLSTLHDSQAGTGRHKCVICAYAKGIERGKALTNKISVDNWQLIDKTALRHSKTTLAIRKRIPVKVDYSVREIRSHYLGLAGELLVVDYEKRKLREYEKFYLADRVEHVSETKGDGLGYDILSYNIEGGEKYIEVKTTSGNENTPFEISDNEVRFSEEATKKFYLYRVYNFGVVNKMADFYMEQGKIQDNFELVSIKYRAYHL